MINPLPGDIGFAYTTGTMGRLIRLGEHLRFKSGSQFNHMFIIGDQLIDGEPNVIQATLKGVTDTAKLSEVAPGGRYLVMAPPAHVDTQEVLRFAKAQVGMEYSLFTIFAIAIDIVTWNWWPSFRGARKPSWICSALAMEAMRFGGFLHSFIDVYSVTPQDGWNALND
jgi:hypothetical protein